MVHLQRTRFLPSEPCIGRIHNRLACHRPCTICVGNGREFEITVNKDGDKDAIYVDKVMLNGKEITDYRLPHKAIADGGTLQIWLTANPKE